MEYGKIIISCAVYSVNSYLHVAVRKLLKPNVKLCQHINVEEHIDVLFVDDDLFYSPLSLINLVRFAQRVGDVKLVYLGRGRHKGRFLFLMSLLSRLDLICGYKILSSINDVANANFSSGFTSVTAPKLDCWLRQKGGRTLFRWLQGDSFAKLAKEGCVNIKTISGFISAERKKYDVREKMHLVCFSQLLICLLEQEVMSDKYCSFAYWGNV